MKISRVAVVLMMCVGIWILPVLSAARSQQAPAAVSASEEAEHEALRQMRTLYEQAIRDNRVEALAPFLHNDFHGVMITGRAVSGLGELKQYWTDIHALMGEGGRYTTTLKPETSVLIGDVALARGTSDDVVVTSEGREFRFTSLWTAVLQKQDGRWQLRQAQGGIDPVDNPFVAEFTRRSLRIAIGVSAAVGILVGWGLAWVFRRRRAARGATA
ncbi:MAG TPA: nuclear transport factor 2 family protein [Vicinamibacterales bacterium]|nr:nuclear transport factor 2 family protein [Vicinamibacterales bacterium]